MGANLTKHAIMQTYQTLSGNTDQTLLIAEKASQTFKSGAPVMVSGGGFIQKWDGTGLAGNIATVGVGIAGVAKQDGANLASDGLGAPGVPWGSVGQPGAVGTFGSVQYQSGAFNIAEGAPFTDGRHIFTVATTDVFFIIQVDNSAGAVAADWTPVQADLGKEFGLTEDANGFWYLDRNKTTIGTNTCVVLRAFDPTVGLVANATVIVQFKSNVLQYGH